MKRKEKEMNKKNSQEMIPPPEGLKELINRNLKEAPSPSPGDNKSPPDTLLINNPSPSPPPDALLINNKAPSPRSPDALRVQCGVKAVKPEKGPAKLTFQGYSGQPVDLSDYGFDAPVVYDIAGISTQQSIPILYNHWDPVGHTTSIRKVDHQSAVRGKGTASLPGENTDKIVEGIQNGFPWQASMGLRIDNFKENLTYLAEGTVNINNRTLNAPLYIVHKSKLIEMTVTAFGRDGDTSFEFLNQENRMLIKNNTPPTPPVPPADPATEPGVKNTKPAPAPPLPPDVKNTDPPTPPTPPAPVLDAGSRRAMSLLNKHPGYWEHIEKGLDNGWDDEAIENSIKLHKLNNNLPTPPSPGKGRPEHDQLLVNMAMSLGASPEHLAKSFDKKLVDNADSRSMMGIQELLVYAANASGGDFNGFSDMDAVCKHLKNSGYSTFDLPEFFEKVGRTIKDERWEINPPFAPSVCKEGNNKDFRPTKRTRITGGETWKQIEHDGKLPLTSSGDQKSYTTELDTFGMLFTVTRRDVINDDMGALSDLMDMIIESATMIPDLQLGRLWLSKAPSAGTFWVDDENSFDNTALNRTNLSARYNAVRQYMENKDEFNWNVMLNDKWQLIVSPNLEETAWELLNQNYIVSNTTSNTVQGSKNFWFGRFELKVFGQMANTSAFGTGKFVGDGVWSLWPKSLKFSPYEITYLRGQKRPVIEQVDLPAELLGFGIRGYWDVNINERERTAIMRATATA